MKSPFKPLSWLRRGSAAANRCKADKRNDPAYCERFWRDYGESHFTRDGEFVPRLFGDIPECVVADKERRRRVRG
jgi:hypothetical protein